MNNEKEKLCQCHDHDCDHSHERKLGKEYPQASPVVPTFKIGRNQLCPCGSGKKYKKCCLK